MESWRIVWRTGFAQVLDLDGLKSLADALRRDDPRLVQGATVVPAPLMCTQDWPCEGGCAAAWTFIKGEPCTVGDAEEYFGRMCFDVDEIIGEPAACRWFLNWFDETPREKMLPEMLAEVEWAIADRTAKLPTAPETEPCHATDADSSDVSHATTDPAARSAGRTSTAETTSRKVSTIPSGWSGPP